MENESIPFQILVWNGSELILSVKKEVSDYSQSLYSNRDDLIFKESSIFLKETKVNLVELEHFQCPHGVSLIETESSHVVQKAVVLSEEGYFIAENNHLYAFILKHTRDGETFQTEEVSKLKKRLIRDLRAGRNHVILMAEPFNLCTSKINDKLNSLDFFYCSTKCLKCREDRELRMSVLQLEADRQALEREKLLLNEEEIDSLQPSMSACLNRRLPESRRTSLCRPHSLSTLSAFSKNRISKERTNSTLAPSEHSFSFLSMDTVYIEDKRQEYESEEIIEDFSCSQFQGQSTQHIILPQPLEIWLCDWRRGQKQRKEPIHVIAMDEKTITEISSGERHCAVVNATGEIYIWDAAGLRKILENQKWKFSPLKLGHEQFVFRPESIGDSTFFLVIGRDSKTSLYYWRQGSVRRISHQNKEQSLLNVYVKDEQLCVVQSPLSVVKDKLLLIFESFQQIRLIKGLCDIFQTIYNLLLHEFDPATVPSNERDVLVNVNNSVRKFYDCLCSIQAKELKKLLNQQKPLNLFWEFGQESFVLCFEDFILKYAIDEAYRSFFPQVTSELENQVSRLALEFNVDSSGISSQIKNLILESLRFFSFLSSKAKECLGECQTPGEKDALTSFLTLWKKKNVLLQRLVTSTKKTKQEAWGNARLAQLKVPGRFLVEVFRVGENQKIKNISVEQPKLYLHKILAIYIFQDIFVTEETKGYKSLVKVCPLPLVWVERQEDGRLFVITPEAHFLIEFNDDSNWFSLCCGSWSDILMEGNPVPVKRQGQFAFSSDSWREHLRLTSYNGSWRMGKLCGRGKLTDCRTEDTEDGMFEDDCLHGFGQVFKSSSHTVAQSTFYVDADGGDFPKKDFYRGVFNKGELHGLAHIRFLNDFCYCGFVKNGIPHGFGVMTLNNEATLGKFVEGTLNGYGVMCTNKEKLLGEFLGSKLHGLGIMINIDGTVAEGEWENGRMKKGKITISSHDGSFPLEYEGETDFGNGNYDVGKQGRLRVSKDLYLEGSFAGNLVKRNLKMSEAVLKPLAMALSPVSTMLLSTGAELNSWSVPVEKRWTILFSTFIKENIGFESVEEIELVRNIWNRLVQGMIKGKMLVHGDVSSGFCDALERIPDYEEFWSIYYYKNGAEYWRLSQDNDYHPLKRLMNGIVEVFSASYSDISAHPVMYSHCVLETKHFIEEIYKIYRMLFPNYPVSPWSHAPREADNLPNTSVSSPESSPEKVAQRKTVIHVPIPCCDFIAETYFTRCSPILFTIYSLFNTESEEKYWSKAIYLNAHTDVKLLIHLEVNQDIWPIAISKNTTRDLDRPIIITTARDKFYRRAVDSLQRLPSETNPSAKLRLLAETYTVMEQCVAEQTEIGDRHVFTADTLLPAFIYVVIRAQIRHLGSEILFLDDFSREWRGEGAIGLLFTMLQSAYMYICNEKSLV